MINRSSTPDQHHCYTMDEIKEILNVGRKALSMNDVYASMLTEYPDLMDIHQMSSALGISTKTGYKLIREGKIIALKIGRTYRISKMHLLMYINMLAQDNTRKTS